MIKICPIAGKARKRSQTKNNLNESAYTLDSVFRKLKKEKRKSEKIQSKKVMYTFSSIFPNEDIMNRAYTIIRESE